MLQVQRVGPYDPNLPHLARRLGQLYDTVHVQSDLYYKRYNLATHKPIFMMIQTTLFLADEHLKKLTCHRCGGWLFVPHPPVKVAKEKNTGKRYLQYSNEK